MAPGDPCGLRTCPCRLTGCVGNAGASDCAFDVIQWSSHSEREDVASQPPAVSPKRWVSDKQWAWLRTVYPKSLRNGGSRLRGQPMRSSDAYCLANPSRIIGDVVLTPSFLIRLTAQGMTVLGSLTSCPCDDNRGSTIGHPQRFWQWQIALSDGEACSKQNKRERSASVIALGGGLSFPTHWYHQGSRQCRVAERNPDMLTANSLRAICHAPFRRRRCSGGK
jgi:hypothetical protein